MEMGYPAIGPFGSAGSMGMPLQGPGGVGMPVGLRGEMPGELMPWSMPGEMMPWGKPAQERAWGAPGQGMPWGRPGRERAWGAPGQEMPWAMTGQTPGGMSASVVNEILNALYSAYNDLTLQCAVASAGLYIPEMKRLPGFAEIHKENYAVSYHLTTAIGAARQILSGAREPSYFALLVTCERKTRTHQQRAREAWQKMTEAEMPQSIRPYLQQIGGRLQGTSGFLQRAIGLTNSALGQETVQRLMEMSREARGEER